MGIEVFEVGMEQGVDRAEIASVGRAEHDGRRTCATVPVVTEGDLLPQHADVLFDVDAHGRLVRLNEPGDEPPPRLFLARGRRTQRIWFRTDVPAATAEACRRIARGLPRWDGQPSSGAIYDGLRAVLAGDEPITEERCGPAYRFGEHVDLHVDAEVTVIDEGSAHLLEPHFPYTRSVLAARGPVAGVIIDGRVVAACFSARRRPTAAEAGVATEEPYRGRGLAPLVVSAWRELVERAGGQPLYSTSWDNVASRAVAAKLRLIEYAETFSLT